MSQIWTTQNKRFRLEITGYDEPNNGRELWIAELFIDGAKVTERYLGSWPRLNFKIDHLQFESEETKHVFIPQEGAAFIIDTDTLDQHVLSDIPLSTLYFMGNFFDHNYLYVVYQDLVERIDLSSYESLKIDFSANKAFEEIKQEIIQLFK